MASTYSTDLKLELMATGENAGTWGTKTNTNLNLLQQAIAGYEAITLTDSATTALVMSKLGLLRVLFYLFNEPHDAVMPCLQIVFVFCHKE